MPLAMLAMRYTEEKSATMRRATVQQSDRATVQQSDGMNKKTEGASR